MKFYNKIVFVAESGTCRAPMAEAILKDIGLKQDMEIISRGLVVLFPEPLNQKAEAVMISNGLQLEGYMSCQLTREDIDEHTLVFVTESKHRDKVLEMFPDVPEEDVWVLTEFVGDELEIINPYGGTLQVYGLCYETLVQSLRKLANILNEGEQYVKSSSDGSSINPA